jgi:hypothetical protein
MNFQTEQRLLRRAEYPILPIETSNYKGDALYVPATESKKGKFKPFEWNKISGGFVLKVYAEGAKNPINWILIQNIESSAWRYVVSESQRYSI